VRDGFDYLYAAHFIDPKTEASVKSASAFLHPADETLVSFGLGKLNDTLAESVGKHLEQCDPCRCRVAEISSDSFLGRLQDAKPNHVGVCRRLGSEVSQKT